MKFNENEGNRRGNKVSLPSASLGPNFFFVYPPTITKIAFFDFQNCSPLTQRLQTKLGKAEAGQRRIRESLIRFEALEVSSELQVELCQRQDEIEQLKQSVAQLEARLR